MTVNEIVNTKERFNLLGKLSYFGLALLLIGIVCIAVGEVNLRNVYTVKIGQEYSVWYATWNLTERSRYGVDVAATEDWTLPFGSGDFTQAQPVNVTITSPRGNLTSLRVYYYSEPSTSPYYKIGINAYIVAVIYQSVDEASLAVDYSSTQIRFTVKQAGTYNVSVVPESVWSTEAPDYILIFEEVTPDRDTYTLLATGGGIIGTVGGATFAVSLFRNRNTTSRRSRKKA